MEGYPRAASFAGRGAREGATLLIIRFATTNAGKIRELQRLLGPSVRIEQAPHGFSPPEEAHSTYVENALGKARALSDSTGGAAIGDDSGLEVDALGGRPGIHSARYAATDAERIARLLDELRGIPKRRRGARFHCALALVLPDGRELVSESACEGEIAERPFGNGGFGYDPIFLVPERQRTFAELSAEEKDAISHRGRAARELRRQIARLGFCPPHEL